MSRTKDRDIEAIYTTKCWITQCQVSPSGSPEVKWVLIQTTLGRHVILHKLLNV